jgi:hypothetical protein
MEHVRVFISYTPTDRSDALYLYSLLDGATTSVLPANLFSSSGVLNTMRVFLRLGLTKPGDVARGRIEREDLQSLAEPALLKPWMDDEIKAGVWRLSIQGAIEASGCFIVLVPQFVSTSVKSECWWAMQSNRPIIPVARSANDVALYDLRRYHALPWPSRQDEWVRDLLEAVQVSLWGWKQ